MGLAWTSVGGAVLFIEAAKMRGKGQLKVTGKLGDVMTESTSIALSHVKRNAERYNFDYEALQKYDIHLHFPAGAVPKDGPSARDHDHDRSHLTPLEHTDRPKTGDDRRDYTGW